MDKTKLILFGSAAIALICMGAFFSWLVTSKIYQKDIADNKLVYANELKKISDKANKDMAAMIRNNNALQEKLSELDKKSQQEKDDAQAANDSLKLDVASGKRRVLIAQANLATCKLSADTNAKASSLGNGTSVELTGEAGRTILNIRGGIINDRAKIVYLQKYISLREEYCHVENDNKATKQTP